MCFPSTVIQRTDYSLREPCPNLNRFKIAELVGLARDEGVYRAPRYCCPMTLSLCRLPQWTRECHPTDRWTLESHRLIPDAWIIGLAIVRPGGEVDCSYTITIHTSIGNEGTWD
jgi:hypothetical protein